MPDIAYFGRIIETRGENVTVKANGAPMEYDFRVGSDATDMLGANIVVYDDGSFEVNGEQMAAPKDKKTASDAKATSDA